MIKKVNNIKTINDKFNTDKISRKRRGRPPIRRSTQTVSVAEVIAEIVGKIPIIEETEEEDTKIILAANHISTLQPQPLALPHYTRKNNIRRSIARLTSKSSKQVISPLPIAMVGEQCLYNGIQRSSFQRPVNQPTQVNGNQPKDQSSPSSSKKIYFSISPKNGGTSTPTPYISLVSPLRKVAVTKNTPKN